MKFARLTCSRLSASAVGGSGMRTRGPACCPTAAAEGEAGGSGPSRLLPLRLGEPESDGPPRAAADVPVFGWNVGVIGEFSVATGSAQPINPRQRNKAIAPLGRNV